MLVSGILYGLLDAFPVIFITKRHLTLSQNGLMFVGLSIGIMIGAVLSFWSMRHIGDLAVKWRGFPPPEERLRGAMIAGPILVLGCLWLGWSGNFASVPWYVPELAAIPIGISIVLSFISFIVSSPTCVHISPDACLLDLYNRRVFLCDCIHFDCLMTAYGLDTYLCVFP
jgi:MFS transporter, DHA1 family, multidrug resistance protein